MMRMAYRHSLWVRLSHWVNAGVLFIMLMSGLQIFNAHPALYWGQTSRFDSPILSLTAKTAPDGSLRGITQIGSALWDTTGVLGASRIFGQTVARGFPAWATLPSWQSLASGRQWHFFFAWLFVANGVLFMAYAVISRHAQRDLFPHRADIRRLGQDIVDHLRLHFAKGSAALRYNALQKIAYFKVIFLLGPLIVFSGLAMSPTLNAAFPFLVTAFGGRQSARTIHFLCAFGFVLFFIVHIIMVVLSGPLRNLRAIITGWVRIEEDARHG